MQALQGLQDENMPDGRVWVHQGKAMRNKGPRTSMHGNPNELQG